MSEEVSAPVIPFLRYRDPTAAVEWLNKAFGFEPIDVMSDDDGKVLHAELRRGNGTIQLSAAGDGPIAMRSPLDLPFTNMGVYMYIGDEVDAHFARAVAAGGDVVMEPADTNYGARVYTMRDLEGHIWSFGTYAPQGG
jgi:uncharacterized glyoxalase superfamily protein PhnB